MSKKHKTDAYNTYQIIADWFDEKRSRELFELPYLEMATQQLKPGATILDIGCGMGDPIAGYFIKNGYQLTGIDASEKLITLAKARHPKAQFILGDMRELNLEKKFDCLIAWHSFFHLPKEDQRQMFQIFENHINSGGILIFTSGPDEGEVWSDNGGELLYHASLNTSEYQELLSTHHFEVLCHKVEDKECAGATVWVAKYINPNI